MNKIIKIISLVAMLFLFCSGMASALTFEDLNITAVNNGNGYGTYDSGGTNVFAITNGTAVRLLDYGAQTDTMIMTAPSGWTINDAFVASDGHLYMATDYGIVRRNNAFTTPLEIDTSVETGNCILITSQSTPRLREEGGYIYYLMDDVCYRFSMGQYLTSVYLDTELGYSDWVDFDVYNGDIYQLCRVNGWSLYKNKEAIVQVSSSTFGNDQQGYMQYTDGGLIYYGMTGYSYSDHYMSAYGIRYAENGTLYSSTTGVTFPSYTGTRRGIALIGSLEPSMAYSKYPDIEVITTEYQGRTSAEPSETAYLTADVASQYDTYVNNTDLYIQYNIATDYMDDDNVSEWQSVYAFKIELVNFDDVVIGIKTISGSSFEAEPLLVAGQLIGASSMTAAGSFKFSNAENWDNGTYSVKLYEVNTINGARALLDSGSFLILFQSYEGEVSTGIDDTNEPTGDEVTTTTFLHSTTFKAIGLIMLCAGVMFLFGGFAGGIVGSGLGIVAAYGFGFISFAWLIILILVVVLAIAALFRDIITGK